MTKTELRYLASLWLMAYGLWLMAYGLWLRLMAYAYGLWLMAYGMAVPHLA